MNTDNLHPIQLQCGRHLVSLAIFDICYGLTMLHTDDRWMRPAYRFYAFVEFLRAAEQNLDEAAATVGLSWGDEDVDQQQAAD